MSPVAIRRGFVDTPAGQVHYRTAGPDGPVQAHPLVMIHASPGSAQSLQALMAALSPSRRVFAPDTLGNGDSARPPGADSLSDRPPMAVFVQGQMDAIDALGLDRFDLYGTHTGANIAAEIAIAWPHRVGRLILDGVSLYSDAERAEMRVLYAPGVEVEPDGSHLAYIWGCVRDAFIYWPWYKRSQETLRGIRLPSPDFLHDKAVEVLKSTRTYHYSYNASFDYRKEDRLPLVRAPTLLACAEGDMLLPYLPQVAALMPGATPVVTAGGARPQTVALMTAFLDAAEAA